MPPVFGPVSCSPTRLKSWAGARATASLAVAEREQRDLLALEQLLDQQVAAERGGRAQPGVELLLRAADEDALAGREPVDLDHAGRPRDGEALRRSARRRPRARPSRRPSSPRSAPLPGSGRTRRCRRGGACRRARPRAAPPGRRRPGRCASSRQSESRPSPSSARTGWHWPSAAMPGLPGAACSSSSCGLEASFQASACSRPPDPTISTFTAAECTAGVGAARDRSRRVEGSPGLLPKAIVFAAGARVCDGTVTNVCRPGGGYAPARERRRRRARGAAVLGRAGRGAPVARGPERARPGGGRGAARDPHQRRAGRGDDAHARARRGARARLLPLRGAAAGRGLAARRPRGEHGRGRRARASTRSGCSAASTRPPRAASAARARSRRSRSRRRASRRGSRSRPSLLADLPERLRAAQPAFAATGGLHATGLFDATGELLCLREDVGRHNALDKVVGWAFREGRLPLADEILCVSGRLSFELVQKAAVAGCPILVAVGAPSSLAVELAADRRLTLCGFARGGRLNVYTEPWRVLA